MAGPGGTLIGRLRVKVIPDTSGFKKDLETDLTAIKEEFKVKVKPVVDVPAARLVETQLNFLARDRNARIFPVFVGDREAFADERGLPAGGSGGGDAPPPVKVPVPGAGDSGPNLDFDLPKIKQVVGLTAEIERYLAKIGGPISQGGAIVVGVAAIAASMSLIVGAAALLPALIATLLAPVALIALGFEGIKTAFEDLSPAFGAARDTLNEINARSFTPLVEALNTLAPILEGSITRLGLALGTIVAAVADFISGNTVEIQLLFTNLALAMEALAPFIGVVLGLLLQMLNFVLPFIPPFLEALTAGLEGMGENFETLAPLIARAITDFTLFFAKFVEYLPFIIAFFILIGEGARTFFAILGTVIGGLIRLIISIVTPIATALSQVQSAFQAAGGGIDGVIAAILTVLGGLVAAVLAAANGIVSFILEMAATVIEQITRVTGIFTDAGKDWPQALRDGADEIRDNISGLVDDILGYFTGLPGELSDIGSEIMDGLLAGIKAGFQPIEDVFNELTNSVPNWKGPIEKDRHLLDEPADAIMGGFVKRIESRFGDVRATFGRVPIGLEPGMGPAAMAGGGPSVQVLADPRSDRGFVEDVAQAAQRGTMRAMNLRYRRV